MIDNPTPPHTSPGLGRPIPPLAVALLFLLIGIAVGLLLFLPSAGVTQEVSFDLYALESLGGEADPEFFGTARLRLRSGEYLAAGSPDGKLYLWVLCAEASAKSPCGPEGLAPDRFGAVIEPETE